MSLSDSLQRAGSLMGELGVHELPCAAPDFYALEARTGVAGAFSGQLAGHALDLPLVPHIAVGHFALRAR